MKVIILALIGLMLPTVTLSKPTVDAVRFDAEKAPELEGPLKPNNLLQEATYLAAGLLDGPEDIAIGPDGHIYTGTRDGNIYKVSFNGTAQPYVYTGGHPLGMDFDSEGNLFVCEPYSGLLKITPDGSLTLLANQADNIPFQLCDDVKVASDGIIYFTDASSKFQLHEFELDFLEARGNGRLLSYNLSTGRVEVLVDGLFFANGVALSKDEDFLLVNETSRYQITRYWLKGERQGERDIFMSNLPGNPDGLARDSNGNFIIAFYSLRSGLIDFLQKYPKLKNILSRLPKELFPQPKAYGFVAVISPKGEFLQSYHDSTGSVAAAITSVEEYKGQLIMGTLLGKQIMVVDK